MSRKQDHRFNLFRPIETGNRWKGLFWLATAVGITLFLYFIPPFLVYAENDAVEIVVIAVVFFAVFALAPYSTFLAGRYFMLPYKFMLVSSFLYPLIVGPTFAIFNQGRDRDKLQEKGQWTMAVVTAEKYIKHTHNISYGFTHNGEWRESAFVSEADEKLHLGDTLPIIFHPDYPKMNYPLFDWQEFEKE